jgi:hypothetical protein
MGNWLTRTRAQGCAAPLLGDEAWKQERLFAQYMKSLGWEFMPTEANQWEWLKFVDNLVVARQGDPTWSADRRGHLDQLHSAPEEETGDTLALRIGRHVIENAPNGATGVYITHRAVLYGWRTNREKFPANFFPFKGGSKNG